jgi:hypothetical protein
MPEDKDPTRRLYRQSSVKDIGSATGSILICDRDDAVSTGSGPGSPRGQPAWGGGCDRVSIHGKVALPVP